MVFRYGKRTTRLAATEPNGTARCLSGMIETAMYIGIGLLAGCLIAITIVPLVHDRAVRLTTQRLAAALPLSIAEVQANQDLLRAEFAMAARRNEVQIEQLRNRAANQLVELGKRTDVINRLRVERDGLKAEAAELKAQAAALRRQIAVPQKPARRTLLRRWTPYRITIERSA
jgi:hypothetical protein